MTDRSRLPGSARARAAALWGLVGALAFLVLHQAYLLLDGAFLGFVPVVVVAVLVGALTTLAAYAARPVLSGRNEQP